MNLRSILFFETTLTTPKVVTLVYSLLLSKLNEDVQRIASSR